MPFFFDNEQREAVTVNVDRYRAMLNEFLLTQIEEEDIGNNLSYYLTEVADCYRNNKIHESLNSSIVTPNRNDILVVMRDFNVQSGPINVNLERIMCTHALDQRTKNGNIFQEMWSLDVLP